MSRRRPAVIVFLSIMLFFLIFFVTYIFFLLNPGAAGGTEGANGANPASSSAGSLVQPPSGLASSLFAQKAAAWQARNDKFMKQYIPFDLVSTLRLNEVDAIVGGTLFLPEVDSSILQVTPPPVVPRGFVPIHFQDSIEGAEATVDFCKLDFERYAEAPNVYPMFRQLVEASNCATHKMTLTISQVLQMPLMVHPSGFVFQESRCGSTLVANTLGVDKENLVYSESDPPSSVLRCVFCTRDQKRRYLKGIITAMGRVPAKNGMFFKFQSLLSFEMDLIREAFPEVPFIFVHRDPSEVLVSHAERPGPCARARGKDEGASSTPRSPLSTCAKTISDIYGVALNVLSKSEGMGISVPYSSLPETLWKTVYPRHFSYSPSSETIDKMAAVSKLYSKSRKVGEVWHEDVEEKRQKVTPEIKAVVIEHKLMEQYSAISNYQVVNETHPTMRFPVLDMNTLGIIPRWEKRQTYPKEATLKDYLPFPALRPLTEYLNQWPPDQPDIPSIPGIAQGTLPRFDYTDPAQREKAAFLQLHEIPFMLVNVPNIVEVSKKWTHEYLAQKFGKDRRKVTTSTSNHFMYYHSKGKGKLSQSNYKPPTGMVEMTYTEWLDHAKASFNNTVDSPHWYLQLNSVGNNAFIAEDLSAFKKEESFFMIDPKMNRDINCRFGARGIIAENHYDGGRNFVAMLKGAKRYILLPPSECKLLYLYPRGHPEARHSAADWSDLDLQKFPLMKHAQATQVVVREGEVLYIPSYWFHYIISTGISAQCNTRSGSALRAREAITQCGFYFE